MKIRYLYALCMLGIVALFSSCSKTPDSAKLLDEESFLVVRIDTRQLLEKSGLAEDGKAKSELKKLFKEEMGEDAKFFTNMIDEPEKIGINFADPVFLAVSGDRDVEVRLVGSVADADIMTDFFKDVVKKADLDNRVKEVDGYHCLILDYNNALVYDDSNFMIRSFDHELDDSDEEEIVDDVKNLFESRTENDLLADEDFNEMCSRDGVAQMLIRGKGVAELKSSRDFERELPDGCELKDIAMMFEMTVDKGEAVLTGEMLPGSDAWKQFFEKNTAIYGDIKAEFAQYLSKENGVVMANIDGGKLFDLLSDAGVMEQIGRDDRRAVRDLLTAINGDIAIGLNDIRDLEDGDFNVSGYVSTSGNKLVDFICQYFMSQGASEMLEKTGSDKYQLVQRNWDGDIEMQLLFGYDKGASYFVFGGEDVSAFGKVKKAFQKSDIKGKGIYAFFNFGFLKNVAKDMSGQDKVFLDYLVSLLDYAEFYNEEGENGKLLFRLVVLDKDKTPIEVLFENCNKFLSDMMESQRIEYEKYERMLEEVEEATEDDEYAYTPDSVYTDSIY